MRQGKVWTAALIVKVQKDLAIEGREPLWMGWDGTQEQL